MEDDEPKKFMFLGRDLEQIPCFKRTFTYGIYSGLAAGLLNFLFTSRVKKSCDISVLSFSVTSIGYWIYCRYQWTKENIMIRKMEEMYHTASVTGEAYKDAPDVLGDKIE